MEIYQGLAHIPRHPWVKHIPLGDAAREWAEQNLVPDAGLNLPPDVARQTIEYVLKVVGQNTWDKESAERWLGYVADNLKDLGRPGLQSGLSIPYPTLEDPPEHRDMPKQNRSMAVMRGLIQRGGQDVFVPWSAATAESRDFIIAIDDCIHTGSTIIRGLNHWIEAGRYKSGFQVVLVALSAHEEGLDRIEKWVSARGGYVGKRIGRVIKLRGVADGSRFPWSLVPGSDLERLAMNCSESREYLATVAGAISSNTVKPSLDTDAPSPEDSVGAFGLLLLSIRAFKVFSKAWSRTGYIAPMGYFSPHLAYHNPLGFGSPFTSWFNIPNTAPLAIWTKPLRSRSLFYRSNEHRKVREP